MNKIGSTLLMALIVCGALGGAIYSAVLLKVQSIKVRAAIVKYTRGDQIAEALDGIPYYENSKLCVSSAIQVRTAVRICGIPATDTAKLMLNSVLDGRFVIPQYYPNALSEIFNQASTPCKAPRTQNGRALTVQGRQLSARSAISPNTCDTISTSSSDNISVDEYRSSAHPRLGSLGYVESNRIIADQNLLIIAGGDIFINRLELLENTSTMIASLTGVLVVEEVSGEGHLTLIAREGVYAGGHLTKAPPTAKLNFEVGNKFIPFQIIKSN